MRFPNVDEHDLANIPLPGAAAALVSNNFTSSSGGVAACSPSTSSTPDFGLRSFATSLLL